LSVRMALEPHLWAPDAYANLVRATIDSLGLQPQDGAEDDSSLPETLLVPRVDVIDGLNVRISHRLSEAPLDAQAHEDAALLLGVFALREASGGFQDTRAVLSRMASHLALAEGLKGARPRGRVAFLGRAVLSCLVGRTREAQDAVDALRGQATTESERAWVRA